MPGQPKNEKRPSPHPRARVKRFAEPPLSGRELKLLKRMQARLLREHWALDEKDRAALVSAGKWLERVRKQLHSRVAASWAIELKRVGIHVRLAVVERWLVKG